MHSDIGGPSAEGGAGGRDAQRDVTGGSVKEAAEREGHRDCGGKGCEERVADDVADDVPGGAGVDEEEEGHDRWVTAIFQVRETE